MASNERIESFIDEKALNQLDALKQSLKESAILLVDNVKAASEFNTAISGSGNLKDFAKNADSAAKSLEKVEKETKKAENILAKRASLEEKAYSDYLKSSEKKIKQLEREQQLAEKAYQRDISRAKTAEKNQQAESKRITEQSRVYVQLNQTLTALRKDAQDIGVIFGTNSVQFKKAADQVNNLDQKLKDIDKQLGKSQRFVGEYERGNRIYFNGLQNSINQISRELPAFTYSAQTGFMAISNNIPILIDEIDKLRKANIELTASGQKAVPVWRQLISGLLSWGTALSIGITLFTVYGKEIGEFIKALFKGTDALDKFTIAQNERNRTLKAYNDVITEGKKSAQTELVSLEVTRKAIENTNIPIAQRNKLVDELQDKYPRYLGNLTNEQILTGKVGTAYKNLKNEILGAAKARAAQDKIVENSSRILDNESKITEARANRIKQQDKLNAIEARSLKQSELNQIAMNDAEGAMAMGVATGLKLNPIRKKIAEYDTIIYNATTDTNRLNADNLRLFNKINQEVEDNGVHILSNNKSIKDGNSAILSQLELEKMRAENSASVNDLIVKDEKSTFSERERALDEYIKYQEKVYDLERQIQLKDDNSNFYDKIRIEEEFQNKKNELNRVKSLKYLEIVKSTLDEEDRLRVEENAKTINLIEKQRDEELLAVQNKAQDPNNNTVKAQEDIEVDRLNIVKKYALLIIQEEINQAERLIEVQKLRGEDTTESEARIAALKLKYSKEATDGQLSDLKKLSEAEKELAKLKEDLSNEIANLAGQIVDNSFENQINKIEKEKEAIDEKAEFDRSNIDNQVLSEEDKAVKLAQIDAESQAKREALDAKQKQLQIKQARFQKLLDIARITSQTFVAASAALLPPPAGLGPIAGIPLASTIAALGAVQVAQVLATQIPQYFTGTDNAKEGMAWVGERGVEGRINPDGQFSLTPNKPTLTFLEKGTKIINNHDLKRMVSNPEKLAELNINDGINLDRLVSEINNGTKQTVKAIKNNNNSPKLSITKTGWMVTNNKLGNFKQYINRNIN